jgi:hypothetical protein
MYADDTVLFSENVHELQNKFGVIDLIRFKSFPVTPHLANFNHSLK